MKSGDVYYLDKQFLIIYHTNHNWVSLLNSFSLVDYNQNFNKDWLEDIMVKHEYRKISS